MSVPRYYLSGPATLCDREARVPLRARIVPGPLVSTDSHSALVSNILDALNAYQPPGDHGSLILATTDEYRALMAELSERVAVEIADGETGSDVLGWLAQALAFVNPLEAPVTVPFPSPGVARVITTSMED